MLLTISAFLCLSSFPLLKPIIDSNGLRCRTWLELSACGQRETEEWMHEIKLHVFKCVYECEHSETVTCLCARVQLYLRFRWLSPWSTLAKDIQSHQRNDMRQQSLYIPSTEQMERDVRWIKLNERGTMSSGGRGHEKNGENNIWQGFVAALMDLRWRINLLIEVTFALHVMSSVYFKHIRSSLNLSSILRRTSILTVVKWDYEELDHIWRVVVPTLVGECNPTPIPSVLPHYQMTSMCSRVLSHISNPLPHKSYSFVSCVSYLTSCFIFHCVPQVVLIQIFYIWWFWGVGVVLWWWWWGGVHLQGDYIEGSRTTTMYGLQAGFLWGTHDIHSHPFIRLATMEKRYTCWDQREVVLDSLGQSQIRTESDDSGS